MLKMSDANIVVFKIVSRVSVETDSRLMLLICLRIHGRMGLLLKLKVALMHISLTQIGLT